MKVFYIYPEFKREIPRFITEEECAKFVKQNKADLYSLTTFADAFNTGKISAEGFIVFIKSDINYF